MNKELFNKCQTLNLWKKQNVRDAKCVHVQESKVYIVKKGFFGKEG